jgi:hypothetical protein
LEMDEQTDRRTISDQEPGVHGSRSGYSRGMPGDHVPSGSGYYRMRGFRMRLQGGGVGQPVGSTTRRVWHILIGGVGIRLHIGIVVQRTQLQFCRASVKLHPLVVSDFAIRFGAALLG